MTPPAFARISGSTVIFFSNRIVSASGSVGPFAASATIFAWILSAFFAVIWFSSAAGISTSTFVSRSSSLEIDFVPGKPTTEPVLCLCSSRACGLNPSAL